MSRRIADQPDLFGTARPDLFTAQGRPLTGSLVDELEEHPGEAFIQQVRDELNASLELARRSASFPWRDLTQTYIAEMRLYSMSRWLPRPEAVALRRAFAAEMDRLYEAADQARPEVAGADLDL